MWKCSKCGESVDDSLGVCWNCGTSHEGIEDPAFRTDAAHERVSTRRVEFFVDGIGEEYR